MEDQLRDITSLMEWYTTFMRIYFAGIGGSGLGPLAEVALSAGNTVLGSDTVQSAYTEVLEKQGVLISLDQTGQFLRAQHVSKPIDMVIYSAALGPDHAEIIAAQQLNIPVKKRDYLVNQIITNNNLNLIAVAGTHGKTTTSAMLVWAMRCAGIPVSYLVGSRLSFGPSGQFDPVSRYFVYECDEFDRNFLKFYPRLSIVTSLDYDHPDVYSTKDDYISAFAQFINQSKACIMWSIDKAKLSGMTLARQPVVAESISISQSINLPGDHNRRNAWLAASALEQLRIMSKANAALHLGKFPGARRRFECIQPGLYSDYGHHPAEITATLQLASEINRRVVLVYQPHQNIRQYEIKDDYTDCFKQASTVYWLPTYLSREDTALEILGFSELTKKIMVPNNIYQSTLGDTLKQSIEAELSNGSLVLCMGAGSIDDWVRHNFEGNRNNQGGQS